MRPNRQLLLSAAVWIAGLGLAVVGALSALESTADRLIRDNAEHTAVRYANNISTHVIELPALLLGGRGSPETFAELQQMQAIGDVFRFKLFAADGRLLLVSDDLGSDDPLKASQAAGAALGGHDAANNAVKSVVLSGNNHVELMDGRGKANRPFVYTEAYVPVVLSGQVVGVVEVYVDSSAQAERIHAAFAKVAAIVGGAMLLVAGALAFQWLERFRERRRAESRMRYLAEHDVLSGALNRASFGMALQEAAWRHEQGGPSFAVHCIDLDRFKEVNDAHGHAGGDIVLREATRRLQTLVRHGDVLARLGGDEFALLQNDVAQADDVLTLGERIVEAMGRPYEVGGRRVVCGGSVGAARWAVDSTKPEDLLHKADVAMYRAKSSGRGRFSFYDQVLDRQLEERRELLRELRLAMAEGQLSLHYQALHAADGHSLLGYEALMRWQHPVRGMVPPASFIPLAEEAGLIENLGRWALERACAEAASWPEPLTVSVNLSAAQFRGELDLVQVVAHALDSSGLAAERLTLEITESLLMSDTESVVQTLTRLTSLGVSIAMDDFGTGYSSLAYLWRFPFDKLKIDRAFTQGLGDDRKVALIVRSIVSLAHSLGIRVNAEGVETELQANMLRKIGCDELQGFLLGRPIPAAALAHQGVAQRRPVPPEPTGFDLAEPLSRAMPL